MFTASAGYLNFIKGNCFTVSALVCNNFVVSEIRSDLQIQRSGELTVDNGTVRRFRSNDRDYSVIYNCAFDTVNKGKAFRIKRKGISGVQGTVPIADSNGCILGIELDC